MSDSRWRDPARARAVCLVCVAIAWLALLIQVRAEAGPEGQAAADDPAQASAEGSPQAPQAKEYSGEEDCLICHEEDVETYYTTPHSWASNPRTPGAAQSCETCHGPGSVHVDEPGIEGSIRNLLTIEPREATEICVSCHNREEHALFQGGQHDSRNLSCVTCHSIHDPKSEDGQLQTASVTETCASCHKTQAMKVRRMSHMPLREGKMECVTCHNPHGSTNVKQLRVGNSINEACSSCHAEKRGPFLWEHAAVRETCVSCHDPHGSSNDRMLVAKAPMLCQRCHAHTRHPATIYDGAQLANSSNRLIGRACVNCHSNIHGSNHPSGNRFLR